MTGVAVGPYSGTFVEEGTFTVGSALSGFLVESFASTFTITSAAGTVTGTKTAHMGDVGWDGPLRRLRVRRHRDEQGDDECEDDDDQGEDDDDQGEDG